MSKQIADMEDTVTEPRLESEGKLKAYLNDLIMSIGDPDYKPIPDKIEKIKNHLRKKYHISPSKEQLRYIYEKYFNDTPINKNLQRFMIKKACRSRSGVLVSTIVLKPSEFSCPKKCAYCPTETNLDGAPTQPKSYLSTEPAMLRALKYNFEVNGQLWDRIQAYIATGNIQKNAGSCKMEIILSGGTWESYPYAYRNQVMNEIYWAANTYGEEKPRPILPIETEITINETAKYRIIGLTLETRPDFITKQSIIDYRKWGVTRVQIGVQHYDDNILDMIKRECHTEHTIKAIKLLKQTGFKIVCHLMPDLPGSNPELDKWMFDQSISNPDLQFDDVKVYPCAVCQSSDPSLIVKSDIADWYNDGTYVPYAEKDLNKLIDVLKYYKQRIQPWVRIQRLVRDIPKQSILAGYEKISNLRQVIQSQMKKEGLKCQCIRCLEIGDDDKCDDDKTDDDDNDKTDDNDKNENCLLTVRHYIASEGDEYFIAIEKYKKPRIGSKEWLDYIRFNVSRYFKWIFTGEKTWWEGNLTNRTAMIGFCRFRIDTNPGSGFIKELANCALIREVHVYGHSLGVGNSGDSSQHKGYGKLLVKTAEEIAIKNGFSKISVIAGVGAREYYKNKCGYHLEGTYMNKSLEKEMNEYHENKKNIYLFWVMILTLLSCIYFILYF